MQADITEHIGVDTSMRNHIGMHRLDDPSCSHRVHTLWERSVMRDPTNDKQNWMHLLVQQRDLKSSITLFWLMTSPVIPNASLPAPPLFPVIQPRNPATVTSNITHQNITDEAGVAMRTQMPFVEYYKHNDAVLRPADTSTLSDPTYNALLQRSINTNTHTTTSNARPTVTTENKTPLSSVNIRCINTTHASAANKQSISSRKQDLSVADKPWNINNIDPLARRASSIQLLRSSRHQMESAEGLPFHEGEDRPIMVSTNNNHAP